MRLPQQSRGANDMIRSKLPFRCAGVWLLGALAAADWSAGAHAQTRSGQSLVEAHCASCHAAGPSGASPNHAAPPLRSIGTRYDLDELAERLRRGTILAGHPDMPMFRFSRSEAHAIRDYLSAIQK
jgi:mono/diheme cytochrome c family protein